MIYSQTLIIISTLILLLLLPFLPFQVQAKCKKGCDLALASYYLGQGSNLTYVGNLFGQTIQSILNYNPHVSNNESNLLRNTRINVPFTCNCLNGEFLGHTFTYPTQYGDTYSIVAQIVFSNLTTVDWLERVNSYEPTQIPDYASINVTINCSCGNRHVSRDYGLFVTYPLRLGDNLTSIAAESGVPEWLLEMYNSGVDFGGGSGLVFVPAKDEYGNFPPMKFSTGKLSELISGILTTTAVVLLLVVFFCIVMYRRKKAKESSFMTGPSDEPCSPHAQGSSFKKASESMSLVSRSSTRLKGITLDKSVEFTYEELARATDGFCLANKIGRGGFGYVYYAELRGEKVAIKKMDMHASKEFLAELKVLTHVHHLNLVRLIGYCVEGALFLVYEFIENGNLSQHLRGSGRKPLPWLARVKIALDAARGLEYIHEHTVPVYIHRDIKSANILIGKQLRGKVADFGLSKLAEYGSASLHTRLVGTFGYMSPEYAQYGDVSPKVDVYAFGVVLYELISAKEAVLKSNEPSMEAKGLVALFEEVLSKPSLEDALCELIDPRLGDNYPLESLHKMALLAKACTQDNPQLRPSMRSIVVALMTLSTSLEEADVGSFYENHSLDNLVIGR